MQKMKWLTATGIAMLLMSTLVFTACQKDVAVQRTTEATIYGRWKVLKASATLNMAGTTDTTSYTGVPVDYFEFTNQHLWNSHFQNDDETSPFTLNGSVLTLINRDEFPNKLTIVTLTSNTLVLYSKAAVSGLPYPLCYKEMTVYLKK